MQNIRTIRVWYNKLGRAKYISHLDLVRFMQRALRRAGIPVWYTEGYNPRPYFTFALPLSLGIESQRECMDIRIDGDMSNEEIKDKLNEAMPEGITVLSITVPEMKSTLIDNALYKITFHTPDAKFLYDALEKALSQTEILAMKQGKQRGRKVLREINMKPFIHHFDLEVIDDVVVLNIALSAGTQKNLSPVLLCETILKPYQDIVEGMQILRLKLRTKEGEVFC